MVLLAFHIVSNQNADPPIAPETTGEIKAERDNIEMIFNFNNTEKPIKDIFSTINQWDYGWQWTHFADNQSEKYFSENYPFVKTVELMVATGGSAERDLFIDPHDRSVLDDYKFDSLIMACENVVRQGLKPNIKTGSVPLKFSGSPQISSSFAVNVRPPDDDKYGDYYKYIKAIADALVAHFGMDEVKTWSWCVLTEYENRDWFQAAGDTTGDATKAAYFKLYDYTVAALRASIGSENLVVGAHAMLCDVGLWDPRDFIVHCATGTNHFTGKIGTQINYITFSLYDLKPGDFTFGRKLNLTSALDFLRNKAVEVGLTNLSYGIDEGYILFGADMKLVNMSHVVASGYQGAFTAKHFKESIECGLDWYSLWSFNTEGIWGAGNTAADAIVTHIARLGSKMVGSSYVQPVSVNGTPKDAQNHVDGFAGYNNSTNTMYVMAYCFNPDENAVTREEVELVLENIAAVEGDTVTVRRWYVDDSCNWFPNWIQDMSANSISDKDYFFSKYSVEVPVSLGNDAAKRVWYENVEKYVEKSTLTYTETTETVINNVLTLGASLDCHGVVFYEITNVRNLQNSGSAVKTDSDSQTSAAQAKMPGYFSQLEPVWGASSVSLMPTLTWESSAGAASYTLVVSANDNLNNPIIRAEGLTETSYTIMESLDEGTLYYWAVIAVNGGGSTAAFTWKLQFTTEGEPKVLEMVDDLNDLSRLFFHTGNFALLNDVPELWEDNVRLIRYPVTDSEQYIVYNYNDARKMQANGLFGSDGSEEIEDFTFYTSPDNENWTQLDVAYNDEPLHSGNWTKRVYYHDDIPEGTHYIKIKFRQGGEPWRTQLGQVILNRLASAD